MIEQVYAACRAVLRPGARVVCAVSGGADSMALLVCMAALSEHLGITLSAAHFNHHLRGAESARDEAFVRAFCAARGIPLTVGGGEVRAAGQSLEAAARRMRYAFLEQAAQGGWILTAHTADDNLETMLVNLLRGTGLRGLCGIPPVRGHIFRPLLGLTHADVRAYLEQTDTPHVEDSSNASDDPLRNRLRHHVLPLLAQEVPDLARRTAATSRLLRADERYLSEQTAQLLAAARTDGGYRCAVLRASPLLSRAARQLLAEAGVASPTARHVALLCELMRSSDGTASIDLPGGLTACRRYDTLQIAPRVPAPTFAPQALTVPGSCTGPGWRLTIRRYQPGEPVPPGALLVPALPDLSVRPRAPGDSIRLPGGRKSLKALMIDRKIPAAARGNLPVLCAGQTILGVPGLGANLDAPPGDGMLLVEWKKGAASDGKPHDP